MSNFLTGYHWYKHLTADTRYPPAWPPAAFDGVASAASSPTGHNTVRTVCRGIIATKKTANGTVTLSVRESNGTSVYFDFEFSVDTLQFNPRNIELNLELPRGMSTVLSSSNMAFVVSHEEIRA